MNDFTFKHQKIGFRLSTTKLFHVDNTPRSLSQNRNRNEGKMGLGRFFAFLRRIVTLFEEKNRKMAQVQLFCNRFSILGQAPREQYIPKHYVSQTLLNSDEVLGYGIKLLIRLNDY